MPFVNVKLIKQQVSQDQKNLLIEVLMDIIVNIMGRNSNTTVITLDEIDQSNWFIGGKPMDRSTHEKLAFIEIRISKGTSNPEQMAEVIKAGKELVNHALGSCDKTNYFIISELNPDSWGFDGVSMTIRNEREK
ncbi:tautomerase family protein [Dysgonomonas macrotermitis]|uniref:4-oxalocrotonate tautomerase n=1 Tax=Dysgonomonas macrotermitis TaxID=1346286 RepID=A0A1M5AWA1_9BACT|nr:tautomerase family protein [Dysgonomonas macrotermitis]SHF34490.1 4-oxalocrotonate tautomerase [Dysgonomonas macrotermitis]